MKSEGRDKGHKGGGEEFAKDAVKIFWMWSNGWIVFYIGLYCLFLNIAACTQAAELILENLAEQQTKKKGFVSFQRYSPARICSLSYRIDNYDYLQRYRIYCCPTQTLPPVEKL
jgi:hypothetical protein